MTDGGAGCSCASVLIFRSPLASASINIIGSRTDCAKKVSILSNVAMPSPDPREILTCGQKWLARLTPFFTAKEREEAGCQHRLFFSQIEFCDNLIFHRRAALDNLGERLLDANRTIGQPNKITMIFGRRISRHYRGKLQTEIEDMAGFAPDFLLGHRK